MFCRVKAAFNRACLAGDGRIEGNTQTDSALALCFGLADGEKQRPAAWYRVDNIGKRDWHFSTGFIGTKSLMPALEQIGRDDVAQRLIHNYESIHGLIETHWTRKGTELRLKARIPANTTATVRVLAADESRVREGWRRASRARGVKFEGMDGGTAVLEVSSGTYNFVSKE